MRKITKFLLITTAFTCFTGNAQSEDYSKLALEFSLGQNKPIAPFSDGYFSTSPSKLLGSVYINHYNAGLRYMFNPYFGLKSHLSYDRIYDMASSGSPDYDLRQQTLGLEGYFNLGRAMHFDSFTSRLTLFVHGGAQYSRLTPQVGPNSGATENNYGLLYGVSPYIRLTDFFALHLDFSSFYNLRQHFNWDGSYSKNTNNLEGKMLFLSVGGTLYFGKGDKHADWHVSQNAGNTANEDLKNRLDEIETLMNDSDKDGVPDYLDVERNSPAGVAVDTKGRFIDTNRNGVPDEMEKKNKVNPTTTTDSSANAQVATDRAMNHYDPLASIISSGYMNVFYDVNKDLPNASSLNQLFSLITYLRAHPGVKVKLKGYADASGDVNYNKELSQRRASKLASFIINGGVSEDRIEILGVGVDDTFDQTKGINSLSRRVTVEFN